MIHLESEHASIEYHGGFGKRVRLISNVQSIFGFLKSIAMIMLLLILPFLAPKRRAVEYCSRCRCEMKQGRQVPSRARTLPMGEVIHSSPTPKGVHSAVRINGKPISRPKGHIRSSSAHQVLTMRAIADRGMSRTSTELPAGIRSPKLKGKVSAKAAKHRASGNGGVSFNDPFADSNLKSSKRMTLPKVSSSPSLQLFRDAKASMKKNSFESSAKKNSFDSSAKKNSFDSDTSASSGKESSTGKDSSASSTSTIGKDSSMSRKESSISKDATPSKMTLALNAAFDASLAVPVKAAKSSLVSAHKASKSSLAFAGKASLASANKASMRISNFAKLQRTNPMAPSPVATPAAVDMPASILSSSSAMTVLSSSAISSSAMTVSSSSATTISSATTMLSASGHATLSESPTSILPESPSSILPEATILPEAAKVSSSWGPFVDVVPPTPQMFSEGTFDGPVAPGLMGFAASDTVGYAASSVSLDERRDSGRSLDADAGDAGSKRYSI